jgi:RND family efflux transporter MFP subunit
VGLAPKILRWLPAAAGTAAVAILLVPGFATLRSTDPGTGSPSAERTPAPRFEAARGTTPSLPSPQIAAAAPDFGDDAAETLPEVDPSVWEAEEITSGNPDALAVDSNPLDCIIEPYDVVEVGSPVTGLIEKIYVERGDSIEAGQVLAELESGVEKAAVALARVRAQMVDDVRSREAELDLGKRRQQRADELFERDALSLDELERLETDTELARLELKEARDNLELAQLELKQAIEALDRRTIRSPIPGVVAERRMSPGEVVDEETILTIAQIDPLRVEVILPAAMFGSIRPEMRAAVVPELREDQVQLASVTIVDRVIDAASGTFGVRLELPNPDHAIPGGLHCRVRFVSE